jgi:hypothetical protein
MRLPARDLARVGLDHLMVFGPFAAIGATDLATALRRLHTRAPTDPLVCLLSGNRRRWLPAVTGTELAALIDRMVVPAGNGSGMGLGTSAEAAVRYLLHHPLGDLPMRVVASGGYVGFRISHAVGDGTVLNAVLPAILDAAATGRAPDWPPGGGTRGEPGGGPGGGAVVRWPIAAALLRLGRGLARDPRRIPSTLPVALRARRPPATGLPAGDPGRRWLPRPAYHAARSADALVRLRAWRDANASGTSMAAVLAAATWTSFARTGIGSRDRGLTVLVDLRRYLPPGAVVPGNLCWGQYLVPEDPADPRSVHLALRAALDSGAPVVGLALRTARIRLTGPPAATGEAATRVPTRPAVELTLTHLGRLDRYADLPWSAPPEALRSISVPPPAGPSGVTVSTSELHGALYVNVGFHASTFDRRAIAESVERLCADPVDLLRHPTNRG